VGVDGIILDLLIVIKGQLNYYDYIERNVIIDLDATPLTLEVDLSDEDALEL
jgi:hypothetical protein